MRLGLGTGASPGPLSVSPHVHTGTGTVPPHRIAPDGTEGMEGGADTVSVTEVCKHKHLVTRFITMLLRVMPMMEKCIH